MSGYILHISISHSHVFLLNSRLGLFSAASLSPDWRPLSRSYRTILPSSLTVNHSSASVFSTQLRVSVYGTGTLPICLADFLGSMITLFLPCAGHAAYCQVRLSRRICLPRSTSTPFNHLFRQMAELSLLRLHITR